MMNFDDAAKNLRPFMNSIKNGLQKELENSNNQISNSSLSEEQKAAFHSLKDQAMKAVGDPEKLGCLLVEVQNMISKVTPSNPE